MQLRDFFNWLNALPDWRFTGTLYLLRWIVILPIGWILSPFGSPQDSFQFDGGAAALLIPLLVLAPTLETRTECMLPYWVIHGLLKVERRSPWPFVVASALVMVIAHPLTPRVITFAFITGSFLAFTYYHFAERSHGKAFLHTAVFHAAINLVGWTFIFLTS